MVPKRFSLLISDEFKIFFSPLSWTPPPESLPMWRHLSGGKGWGTSSQNNWSMSGPIFYLGLSPMISSPQKTSPFSEAGPDERWKEENYFLKLDDRWKLVLMKTIFSNLRRDNRGLCSQLWLWVLPFERTILQLYLSVFIKYVNSNLIKLFEFFLLNGRSCNFIFFSLEFKTRCSSCLGFDLNWVNGWWSLPDTAWNRSIY